MKAGDAEACVPAIASLGDLSTDVTLCPHHAAFIVGGRDHPVFELQADAGEQLLSVARALLTPVRTDAALVAGYFQSLADIGIPVPTYEVVRLTVNGTRWGLYAMEELWMIGNGPQDDGIPTVAFGGLLDSERLPGGLGSSFARAEIHEGYLPSYHFSTQHLAVASDSVQIEAASRATESLRAVLNGQRAPASIVDAERLGQMMALTALWRGCLAPDWRAIQFAYDANAARFIPLAMGLPQSAATPLPAQLYNDLAVQQAYVQALQTYSDPAYRRDMIDALDLEVRNLAFSQILRHIPDLDTILADNQARMRRVLSPLQTLRAQYRQDLDILHIDIEVTEPLPVVVSGLEFGAQGYLPLDAAWVTSADDADLWVTDAGIVLPARTTDIPLFFTVRIPRIDLPVLASTNRAELSFVTHILGVDERVVVKVEEAPSMRDPYGQ